MQALEDLPTKYSDCFELILFWILDRFGLVGMHQLAVALWSLARAESVEDTTLSVQLELCMILIWRLLPKSRNNRVSTTPFKK